MMVEKKMMDEQKCDLQNQTDFFFHRSTFILSVYPHGSWLTPLFSPIINILNTHSNLKHVVGTRGSYKNPSGYRKNTSRRLSIRWQRKFLTNFFLEKDPTSRHLFNFMETKNEINNKFV